jgi:hypothetical protein
MEITPPSQTEKQRDSEIERKGAQYSELAGTIPPHSKLIKYIYKFCTLLLSGFRETLTL